ncbi:MAG: hypothetical protein B7Y59_07710 [Burkholderiales bacterium 35-55-47]|jgi:Rrf2 family iron-sulfur cluster assembly transcriptional regulator|uniref:RrF2 family transcriptional regulator n=1 Tax=Limnohabitans sp. TaxID=1907725 RepID=UPI000BD802CF|nr:Rrf2 family transcriptional regulator [Limnohabitans sp.]OYY18966.1 MAG: hypothetical protein B7Y59_07710 [Burkholderiales bacterium 35-55-47]OYZ73785.1 MAG: hypothetical protein B7Y06_07140 [Burkholderiales bacterium 24-55-52]OZB00929.1 MAG: hypothetical protein B7X62_07155 [Burkholderiales bacterium 39-55-53]HQR85281.1 Rrf2 family transcriptional regulator [Limnohabitans sp.]HQS27311.1 Rrf2 family transcriptional regulator [Limnohabitans sp.]
MAISLKSKIAVSALIDLATNQETGSVSLDSIAARLNISVPNLQKIFLRLREQGIVSSRQGPGGGYKICISPLDIKLGEIVRIFELQQPPSRSPIDVNTVHKLFEEINLDVFKTLDDLTLQSLIDKNSRP